MTALTTGRLPKQLAERSKRRFPVAAATVCWEGGMVGLSGSGAAAVAVPMATSTSLKCVGVADGTADNRLGLAGAVSVDVDLGVFLMNVDASDPVTIADIGNSVYAKDDNTISRTNGSSTRSVAGVLFSIDPTGAAWVAFS